jgi:hypothetical protein
MNASENRVLECNKAKLKQSHEEQTLAMVENMEIEGNLLKEEKKKI